MSYVTFMRDEDSDVFPPSKYHLEQTSLVDASTSTFRHSIKITSQNIEDHTGRFSCEVGNSKGNITSPNTTRIDGTHSYIAWCMERK